MEVRRLCGDIIEVLKIFKGIFFCRLRKILSIFKYHFI